MKFIKNIGNHNIYEYDIEKHPFIDFFANLYNTTNFENLHLNSFDYKKYENLLDIGFLNDCQTDLHDLFYNKIKSNNEFKILYCNFIKDIYKNFFPNEKYILYQSFPSIRIQYPKSIYW
jgi:hypothetical protein